MQNLFDILLRELFHYENQITHLDEHLTLINDMEAPYAADLSNDDELALALNTPFRVDQTLFVYCHKGEFSFKINLMTYTLHSGDLLCLPPNTIGQITDGMHAWMLVIMANKRLTPSQLQVKEYSDLYMMMMAHPVLHLDESMRNRFVRTFKLLEESAQDIENTSREEIVSSYLRVLYLYVQDALRKATEKPHTGADKTSLFMCFLNLMECHFKDERTIAFYADKLHLSPKYASQLIREASGRLAGDWIRDRVILEAKLLLAEGRFNIKQIAYKLNFRSQSVFCKYFKSATGVSPSEYIASTHV